MNETVELRGTGFRATPLTSDNRPELQRLLETCTDYFDIVLGRPPGATEAQSVLHAGPEEGRDPRNKMIYSIRRTAGDRMVGVLDAFRNYPEEGSCYIGLLLFSPETRGEGLGREVIDALVRAARAFGAVEIQLNVVEQNEAGYRFWAQCGFEETRRWKQRYGERESTFIRMRRRLQTRSRAERLSAAAAEILAHPDYRATVDRLKSEIATSPEPFVWSVIDTTDAISALAPANIKSAWIFVLKKETPSGEHFHPNSSQHMAMIEGQGKAHVGERWSDMMRFEKAANPEDAWIVIDESVSHEFFPKDEDMVVISFHTVPADELIEIDAATGRNRVYEVSVTD